jgi:antitoxin YefM
MISLADWNAIEETIHLLSTKRNEGRLKASIEQLERDGGKARDLIQP